MKYLAVFIVFGLILAGCMETEPATTPSPSPIASPSPTPLPSPSPVALTPLEFEYEVSNFFGSNDQDKATITYWFEEEAVCSGKKAFNGIYSVTGSQMGDGTVWAKTTYYYEDGELASTDFTQKSQIVFEADDVIQAPIILNFFQELFAAAGKDLTTSEIWESTKPLPIKDVVFFNNKANVSVVNEGNGHGVIPCTEFALYSQDSPGAVIACATQPTEEAPYSITVYIEPGDDWPENAGTFPTWKLVAAPTRKASGESALLECIDFVRCGYVKQPSGDEREQCEAKDSKLREDYDKNSCVTGYKCKKVADIAEEQIRSAQNPACGLPSQDVIDAVEECIRNDSGGINWSNNQNGCVESASC